MCHLIFSSPSASDNPLRLTVLSSKRVSLFINTRLYHNAFRFDIQEFTRPEVSILNDALLKHSRENFITYLQLNKHSNRNDGHCEDRPQAPNRFRFLEQKPEPRRTFRQMPTTHQPVNVPYLSTISGTTRQKPFGQQKSANDRKAITKSSAVLFLT